MVEWKKIEDICDVFAGGDLPNNYIKANEPSAEYLYPIYSNGIGEKSLYGYSDSYRVNDASITISARGTIGYHTIRDPYFTPIVRLITLIPKNKNSINLSYLNEALYMTNIDGTKGGIPQLTVPVVSKISVPVPSLSEQQRIVGILDTFTSSIENLKEQIAHRRKQYEYYRDQLLDLEGKEGVKQIVLKDVCDVINGRAYSQPELLSEGKYRVLRVGNFFSNDSWYYSDLELEDKYYCNEGDLLYAWSASFGPHIWEEEKVIYHYHIWKMNCKEGLQTKYMYYWLQSEDMKKKAFSNLHGATMAHLTKVLMESLKVPIPSFSEQQRIVSILDTFEASIANLEAQLAQREKQYEYYRNKLLTFSE